MLSVLPAGAAVVALNVYAVLLIVLRSKVYRVGLYRPMLLNVGLSALPVLVSVGVWGGLIPLAAWVLPLADSAPGAVLAIAQVYTALTATIWLLLFPNSVYLITELNFSHRTADTPVPLWYDIIQTLVLTLSGLANAILSLGILQLLLTLVLPHASDAPAIEAGIDAPEASASTLSWVLSLTFIVLGALGVYLGRYLRFYSWDVRHPGSLVRKLVAHLREPGKALEAVAFVATHAVLVALLYVPLFSLALASVDAGTL